MKKVCLIIIIIIAAKLISAQTVNGEIMWHDSQFKVLKVWGNHYERGYAMGYLLAENINDLRDNYLLPAFGDQYQYARLLFDYNVLQIDDIYINEATGVADGYNERDISESTVDYIDVLIANSFLDIQNFSSAGLGLDNGCSSLLSWGNATEGTELDGKSVITRHLDWDNQSTIIRNQVMIIHLPSEPDEQAWLLIGFAGQISVLSGLNESGVAVMQHMLADVYAGAQLQNTYEPVWFSLRKAIETKDYNNDGRNDAEDVNSVIMEQENGYADSYIITALSPYYNSTNAQIASIIEVSPAEPYITVRNTDYADSIAGDNLYAANYSIARNDMVNLCMRYEAVMNNMGDGSNLSAENQWDIMLNYSSSCAFNGYGNIQFMQYIPEDNYLKLAYHTITGLQACENIALEFNTDTLFDISNLANSFLYNDISIRPNPANNNVQILCSDNYDSLRISIFTLTGKLVKCETITCLNNNINISELEGGVYFIKINNRITKKLIKL
jgi:hypothetical protein